MCDRILKVFVFIAVVEGTMTVESKTECNCVPLRNCPSVNLTGHLSDTTRIVFSQLLKSLQCGYENDSQNICCPAPSDKIQRKQKSDEQCHDGTNCVSLKLCQPFMNLIKSSSKPLKTSLVHYLRSQECGFENDMPKVCCASVPYRIQKNRQTGEKSERLFNKLSVDFEEETISSSTRRVVHTTRRSTTTKRTTKRKRTKTFEEFKQQFFSQLFDYPDIF